ADEHARAQDVPWAHPAPLASPASAPEPTRTLDQRTACGARQALSPSAAEDPPSLALPSPRSSVDPRWEPGAGNPLAGLCPGGGPSGPQVGQRRAVPTGTPAREGLHDATVEATQHARA